MCCVAWDVGLDVGLCDIVRRHINHIKALAASQRPKTFKLNDMKMRHYAFIVASSVAKRTRTQEGRFNGILDNV